jgi:hypothetical protein
MSNKRDMVHFLGVVPWRLDNPSWPLSAYDQQYDPNQCGTFIRPCGLFSIHIFRIGITGFESRYGLHG